MSKLNWYQLKNVAEGQAEISIRGDIGIPKVWGEYGYGDAGGTATEFEKSLKALGQVTHITLRLYTRGGYIYDAMAMHDILRGHPAQVTARIDGLAASAGTFLMLAADKIEIPANAWLMIHNVQGVAGGDHRDFAKYAAEMESFCDDIANMYKRKIIATKGEADLVAIRAMMDAETWLNGQKAYDLGLVDEVLDRVNLSNCLTPIKGTAAPLVNLDRVPVELRALFDNQAEDMAKKAIIVPGNKNSNRNAPPKAQGKDTKAAEEDPKKDPESEEEEEDPEKDPENEEDDEPKKDPENEGADDPEKDPEEDEDPPADPQNLAKIVTDAVNKAVDPLKKEIKNLKALHKAGIIPENLEGGDPTKNPKQPQEGKMPTNLTPMQKVAWARSNPSK